MGVSVGVGVGVGDGSGACVTAAGGGSVVAVGDGSGTAVSVGVGVGVLAASSVTGGDSVVVGQLNQSNISTTSSSKSAFKASDSINQDFLPVAAVSSPFILIASKQEYNAYLTA